MKRREFITALMASTLIGFVPAKAAEPSKIKVGILLPLTGPFAAVAETQKQGALLAIDSGPLHTRLDLIEWLEPAYDPIPDKPWSERVPRIIAHVSEAMTLLPGDVILTGTPAGIGRIEDGQVVEISIEGIGMLTNPVRSA